MRRLDLVIAIAIGAIALLVTERAHAHFTLTTPTSWAVEDGLGSPQKSAPCGQLDPGAPAVATNAVTTYRPGETITVTLSETITHPGHYRVTLATTQSALPPDPPVTAGSTPCGSTIVQNPAVFPVLADGVLEHTSTLSGPQTIQVKLPDGMTCTKCTLQVIEFMSSHNLNIPGGCFYHHCADISIQAAGGTDSGATDAGADSGTTTTPSDSSTGCGCTIGRSGTSAGTLAAAAALAILIARRRRRRV